MDAEARFHLEGGHENILRPAVEHDETRCNHGIVLYWDGMLLRTKRISCVCLSFGGHWLR